MAVPDLTPISQTSRIVLPMTGTLAEVDSEFIHRGFGRLHKLQITDKVQQTK